LSHISRLGAHTIRVPATGQHSSDPRHTWARFLHEDAVETLKENNNYWRKKNCFLFAYDVTKNKKTKTNNVTRHSFIVYESKMQKKNNPDFILWVAINMFGCFFCVSQFITMINVIWVRRLIEEYFCVSLF
jgi:hypothetical protein